MENLLYDNESDYTDYSEDSDGESEGLLRKALDVTLPYDFVPIVNPGNGTEFLQNVIFQRKNMKRVVCADEDLMSKIRDDSDHVKVVTIPNPPTDETGSLQLPTLEWQLKKLEEFKQFIQFVEQCHKPEGKERRLRSKNEQQFVSDIRSHSPKYSVLFNYSHESKLSILEILTTYLSKQKLLEDFVGPWLLYILSTLGYPPSPGCCHTIREFLRVCRSMRSKYSNTMPESSLKALNFYICISSRYYGQLDLADGHL
ncbi:gem-associated protein 2-like [Diabrotica undecimpunctata]|uniref:gem-associated protein 2-like n=1 Tax=Diabrotica undecimpunctata TaxID=50387 RepID=UPI003B637304